MQVGVLGHLSRHVPDKLTLFFGCYDLSRVAAWCNWDYLLISGCHYFVSQTINMWLSCATKNIIFFKLIIKFLPISSPFFSLLFYTNLLSRPNWILYFFVPLSLLMLLTRYLLHLEASKAKLLLQAFAHAHRSIKQPSILDNETHLCHNPVPISIGSLALRFKKT